MLPQTIYGTLCHVSCGDIFGHFHSFNETNLQIFGRNPSVPGVHKPANNSQLLDVMGTSFTDGVETRCQNMVPKVYTFLSFSFVGLLARGSIASGGIVASAKFSRSYLRLPLSSHLSTSFNLAKFPDSFLGSNITDYPHTIRDHLSSVTLIGRWRSQD